MPHLKGGQPAVVGQRVLIPATITAVHAGTDYCNMTVETDEPMHPGNTKTTISLNTGQAIPAEPVAPPAAE